MGAIPSRRGASLLSCGRDIASTLRALRDRHPVVGAVCLEGFMKGFASGRWSALRVCWMCLCVPVCL